MAKAQVTLICSVCGQPFIKTKTCHNRTEANSWEEWMKRNYGLCPDCYHEQFQQKTDELAEAMLLPQLQGTERQISYAMNIRKKFITDINRHISQLETMLKELENNGEATSEHYAHIKLCKEVLSQMLTETNSEWWIQNAQSPIILFDKEMENAYNEISLESLGG